MVVALDIVVGLSLAYAVIAIVAGFLVVAWAPEELALTGPEVAVIAMLWPFGAGTALVIGGARLIRRVRRASAVPPARMEAE